jgi:hypothetical protein
MTVGELFTIITRIPELARDAVGFTKWNIAHGTEEDNDFVMPMAQHEAARVAMEMVMVLRTNKGNSAAFNAGMDAATEQIDSPQHAFDVALSLAGMVAVLADDDDLQRLGTYILKHEVRSQS